MTQRHSNHPFQVLGVTSGKGGVGKTNLTVNLAIQLGKLGRQVLVIDADMGLANVDILMDETPKRTLEHVVLGEDKIEDVLVESKYGVTILPGASGVSALTNLDQTQRMRLLQAVDGIDERFDTLIVDTPAGIGSNAAFFASAVQDVMVIATPEPTSMTDAYAMIKVLNRTYGIERVGLVLNQVDSIAEAQDVYLRLTGLTSRFLNVMVELIGWLPLDVSVRHSVMLQRPISVQFPNSPYSVAVHKMAQKMMMRPQSQVTGRLQFFWNRLFGNPSTEAAPTI